jgi:hypothetical protein
MMADIAGKKRTAGFVESGSLYLNEIVGIEVHLSVHVARFRLITLPVIQKVVFYLNKTTIRSNVNRLYSYNDIFYQITHIITVLGIVLDQSNNSI